MHSADFASGRSAPRLGAKMLRQDSAVKSSLVVNEVAGELDARQIGGIVERACGAEKMVIDAASEFEPNFSRCLWKGDGNDLVAVV